MDPKEKVMIVDDEDLIRLNLRAAFEDLGYSVVEAANGLEGLEVFFREKPDIVFTDLRMPEMDGLTFLSELRDKSPETPTVVVSGTGTMKDAIEALRMGAWDYVTKPIQQIEEIEITARHALERARLITENKSYREHLEKLVQERTLQLREEVEVSNSLLQIVDALNTTLDERTLIKNVMKITPQYLKLDRMFVFLYEEDRKGFIFSDGYGLTPFEEGVLLSKNFKTGDSPAIDRALKGEMLIIENPEERGLLPKDLVDAFQIDSMIIVPISFREKIIGGIFGDYRTAKSVEQKDLSLLRGLASGIGIALENARLYKELEQLLISTITALASAIDAKSPWTKGHSERVTRYAIEIGKEMGLKDEELERLRLAGLLHDIGKIGIVDVLLDKTEKLTGEELEHIKKHPRMGVEILAPIKQLGDVIPAILHHHERYDGNGHPDGLKGEDIPLHARILCIADSYDSMTADRPYRNSPGKEYAISEFKRFLGTQFDPKVVKAFLKVLERLNTEI